MSFFPLYIIFKSENGSTSSSWCNYIIFLLYLLSFSHLLLGLCRTTSFWHGPYLGPCGCGNFISGKISITDHIQKHATLLRLFPYFDQKGKRKDKTNTNYAQILQTFICCMIDKKHFRNMNKVKVDIKKLKNGHFTRNNTMIKKENKYSKYVLLKEKQSYNLLLKLQCRQLLNLCCYSSVSSMQIP